MRKNKAAKSNKPIAEQARELLYTRRVFLADNPQEQWLPVGVVSLYSILVQEDLEELPTNIAYNIQDAFLEAFGNSEENQLKSGMGRASMRDDGGRQGGKPAGRILLASGKRMQK